MMVKSGLEKIPPKAFFRPTDLLNVHVCAWRDFNSTSCVLSRYPKRPVRTEKSSIFNIEYVNKV